MPSISLSIDYKYEMNTQLLVILETDVVMIMSLALKGKVLELNNSPSLLK